MLRSDKERVVAELAQRLREADTLKHPLREFAQLQPPLGADAEAIEYR